MSIQAYAITSTSGETSSLEVDGKKILSTLGDEEEAVAVQLQELFNSVTKAIKPSIETESDLNIEVSGSLSIKASGGIKYLFFNVGGEAASMGTMKVTLSTKIQPVP